MPEQSRTDLAIAIAERCHEKKAFDIVILDVAEALGITEFFVVCSVHTTRQARMVAEHCERLIKDRGSFHTSPMEGVRESNWVCGDFGDVVLQVFLVPTRDYYDLEHKWDKVPRVPWTPPAAPNEVKGDAPSSSALTDTEDELDPAELLPE